MSKSKEEFLILNELEKEIEKNNSKGEVKIIKAKLEEEITKRYGAYAMGKVRITIC